MCVASVSKLELSFAMLTVLLGHTRIVCIAHIELFVLDGGRINLIGRRSTIDQTQRDKEDNTMLKFFLESIIVDVHPRCFRPRIAIDASS